MLRNNVAAVNTHNQISNTYQTAGQNITEAVQLVSDESQYITDSA